MAELFQIEPIKIKHTIDRLPVTITWDDTGYTYPKLLMPGMNPRYGLDFYPERETEEYTWDGFNSDKIYTENRNGNVYATLEKDKPKEKWQILINKLQLRALLKQTKEFHKVKKEAEYDLRQIGYL
jgi:hypothetical protein